MTTAAVAHLATVRATATVARAHLAAVAIDGSSRDIAQASCAVAVTLGALEVAERVAKLEQDSSVTRYLVGLLTRGADDTWSGRGNDVARAHYDGVREEAAYHLDKLIGS